MFSDSKNELFAFYTKYLLQHEFDGREPKYNKDSPPFGSVKWILSQRQRHGDDLFLKQRCGSYNPMMMYLFDKFEGDFEKYLNEVVSEEILYNLLLNINNIDYAVLSYGNEQYRIYSQEEINKSRELMIEWLKNPAARDDLDKKLLNHHAWVVRAAESIINGEDLTLKDCLLGKY